MTDIDREAVRVLTEDNYRFNIDMIEPLRTGIAKAIDVDEKGVLIDANGCYMWTASDENRARQLTDEVARMFDEEHSVCVHTKKGLEYAAEKLKVTWRQVPCFVAALFEKQPYKIETELEFRKLDHQYDMFVKQTYNFFKDDPDSLPYAHEAIDRGIIGGFLNRECIGFIGTHEEGTMGMLEVLPAFRRRGYGKALEQYLMNELIKEDIVPFCHILETNTASLELQSSMGLWLSGADRVYWMGR